MDARDVLARRAAALARVPETRIEGESARALVAVVGDQRIGFPMDQVLRVRPIGRCMPVPNAPPGIVGVAKVDGRIAAVFGARTWRGIPESVRSENPVLVLGPRDNPFVLVVDSVVETIDIPGHVGDLRNAAEPWLRAILGDVLLVDVPSLIESLSQPQVSKQRGTR